MIINNDMRIEQLHLENIGVFDSLDLQFKPGNPVKLKFTFLPEKMERERRLYYMP